MKVIVIIEHLLAALGLLKKKPSPPTNLRAEVHMSNVQLNWTAPTLKPGQSSIAKYRVYSRADGAPSFGLLAETPDVQLIDEGVAVGTWSYQVTTVDSKGRESGPSNVAQATVTIQPDSVPPDPPGNLTAKVV